MTVQPFWVNSEQHASLSRLQLLCVVRWVGGGRRLLWCVNGFFSVHFFIYEFVLFLYGIE